MPTGVLVYGHMPLMVTRACPLQNIHDCAHCDKTGVLTDRKAKKFPVRCGMGVRTIYNPVPIYMGDKPGALTVDYGVAYFTLESREEAAAIWTLSASMHPLRAISPADSILKERTKTPSSLTRCHSDVRRGPLFEGAVTVGDWGSGLKQLKRGILWNPSL